MERVESELEEQEYGVVVENIGFSAKLVKFKFLPSAYKLCDFRQIIWSFYASTYFAIK